MKNKTTVVLSLLLTGITVPLMAQVKGDVGAGKAKYNQLCTTCHGATGKGDGPAGAALNPKPRDLSQTKRTDAELAKIIKQGGAAAGLAPIMPAWGASLSDQDIANVIAYIRSLGKGPSK